MIGDFHFLRPWWLLAILAAVALAWTISRREDVRSRWRGMIAPSLLDHLVLEGGAARRFRPVHLVSAAIALGAIAAAGPTFDRERPPFVDDKAPLAIAIDLSQTMDATDISPTRLERAKLKVQDLLERRKGARTAVFAYAGSAHMVLPLTDDATLVQTYVNSLATRIMPETGKDSSKALRAVQTALASEEVPGTILFMTDGVEPAAFDSFKQNSGGDEIMVLGIGTEQGGPIKIGEGRFLTDSSGARVFAKMDVSQLQKLQSQTGVQVATVTLDDSDVGWIKRRIQSHLEQSQGEGNSRWRDLGWWLTIPVALLGALWFRRGWSVHWASGILLGFALVMPGQSYAQTSPFMGMWLTHDQQGRLAFENGDYRGAAADFDDPMWRGVAHYRAGEFAEAVDAFAQIDSAESYYNEGNALAHLDRLPEAAQSYLQALKRRPDWPEAKDNLGIIQKLIADREKEDKDQAQDPNLKPDQIQFDEKGKKGKEGTVNLAEQSAEMWMRNIQVTPTDLLARKFAIEASEPAQ
ncbi:VWA domain-containing protein [Mesorhizobium sp. BAC0120]|uniref:VWA domain-containing protein n=1 Tax=Mesorhizobium sp. BAC0120 TaxID=3090670 RepID=UPI00298CF020|nr:VWA domain-containing protein [Mesorhizobium sp. BAC0120]MDW6022887.1 VWA domain-containing protein [Mesorhizobium sp. BAC0120]